MALLKDGAAKGFIVGNIDVTLVDENACIDLPVGKVGMEWKGNILIHRLESLEDKGSPVKADSIWWERATSMTLIKRDRGRRVTPSLLSSEWGRRSGQQERVSGPAKSFPRTWIIFRSKLVRSTSQQACWQLRVWGEWKYVRFLWSVKTWTGNGDPWR